MNPFAPLVPRLWAPDEALGAIVLLRHFIDAVWQVHGERMAAETLDHPERWAIEDLLDQLPLTGTDEVSPF